MNLFVIFYAPFNRSFYLVLLCSIVLTLDCCFFCLRTGFTRYFYDGTTNLQLKVWLHNRYYFMISMFLVYYKKKIKSRFTALYSKDLNLHFFLCMYSDVILETKIASGLQNHKYSHYIILSTSCLFVFTLICQIECLTF